jgi:hypothetical protein
MGEIVLSSEEATAFWNLIAPDSTDPVDLAYSRARDRAISTPCPNHPTSTIGACLCCGAVRRHIRTVGSWPSDEKLAYLTQVGTCATCGSPTSAHRCDVCEPAPF